MLTHTLVIPSIILHKNRKVSKKILLQNCRQQNTRHGTHLYLSKYWKKSSAKYKDKQEIKTSFAKTVCAKGTCYAAGDSNKAGQESSLNISKFNKIIINN